MLPDARDIARMVSVPQMLRHLRWRTRHRNRADCGLCKGRSNGTLAFTEQFWKCHRCNDGGDVYSLVRAVQGCDFVAALRYVAELGGVRLADSRSAEVQHEIAVRRQQRERIDRAAEKIAEVERTLRIESRDGIHECDRILAKPGPWDTAQWQRAKWAHVLRRDFLLPEYTLMAFGSISDRVRYVLASDAERTDTCGAIRLAGGARTDSSFFMEVLS